MARLIKALKTISLISAFFVKSNNGFSIDQIQRSRFAPAATNTLGQPAIRNTALFNPLKHHNSNEMEMIDVSPISIVRRIVTGRNKDPPSNIQRSGTRDVLANFILSVSALTFASKFIMEPIWNSLAARFGIGQLAILLGAAPVASGYFLLPFDLFHVSSSKQWPFVAASCLAFTAIMSSTFVLAATRQNVAIGIAGIATRYLILELVVDFVYAAAHKAMHTVPWLTKIHSVHHARATNKQIQYHPIETVGTAMLLAGVLGLVGASPAMVLTSVTGIATYVLSSHSKYAIDLGHHQGHHNAKKSQNFGLHGISDRVLGTFGAVCLKTARA